MSTSKKKKKKAILILNMGDTVKLSKGRIGLVRFIGKTQFGLGEWIGIELYNELIKTRHNGAVLGKRYFRAPAHRGVFIRRQLIRENIPVRQIDPSIKNLRKKEKILKDKRKKLLKKQKNAKKQKNVNKKQTKLVKERKKYSHLTDNEFQTKMDKKYTNNNTEKEEKKNDKNDKKEKEKEEKNDEKQNQNQKKDNDIDCNYDWNGMQKKTELKKLKSEFSNFSVTIDQKMKDIESEKHIRKLWVIGSKLEIYSYSNEAWYIGEIIDIKMENNTQEWLQIKYLESKFKELERYSDDIRILKILKNAIITIDSTDGILESDDSLNDSEQECEEKQKLQVQNELEEDFEQNYAHYHNVIDEYEHQIDHFEVARKNLAKKLMEQRKKNVIENDTSNKLSNRRVMRSAESRRASTFVDSKSIADSLFFDGNEEINDDINEFIYVDEMESDSYDSLNETEDEIDEIEEEDEIIISKDEEIMRNLWIIGTKVEIYSYSYEEWFLGEIIHIKIGCEEENDGEEWLEVKYLESKFKEIQRYSHDVRSIQLKQRQRAKTKVLLDDDDVEQDSLSEEEEEIFNLLKDKRDTKIVMFFTEFSKFLTYIANENGYGILIDKIHKNKSGKLLYIETGLESGWLISKINDKDISQMIASNIEKIIERINENISNEYTVTFQRKGDNICKGNNLKPSAYVRSKKNLHAES